MLLEDEFGDIILKARAGLGLSVDFVSKHTGMTKTEVTMVEGYSKFPNLREIELLAAVLHLNPIRLGDIAFHRYVPKPTPSVLEKSVLTIIGHVGKYEVKGYLVVDPSTKEAAMIDTANNPEGMIDAISKNGWKLKFILLTHTHQDHIGGLKEILEQIKVPVYVSQEEVDNLGGLWDSKKDRMVREGDKIILGKIGFDVLEIPGHTAGGRGYFSSKSIPPFGFFGDSIFAGSLGRAYSINSYPDLLRSVKDKVFVLDEDTVIYPGHGPATTVGEEMVHNPFFVS